MASEPPAAPDPIDVPSPAPDPVTERNNKVQGAVELLRAVDSKAAARLNSLNKSLNNDLELSRLANVNIYGVFNPAEIERRAAEDSLRANSILWSGLELVRNVFILVPITFTWFSFWAASQDYATALTGNPELAGSSFLYLWETGFDGHATFPFLTFSHTAIIDALLLAFIILLTGLVHYRKDIAATSAANSAVQVRMALENALWEIEKTLSIKRHQHTEAGVAADLYAAVRVFRVTAEQVATAVKSMDGGARAWMGITTEFDLKLARVVEEMKDEADGLRVFSNGLTGNVDRMLGHVDSANATSDQLKLAVDRLTTSIEDNATRQEENLTEIVAQLTAMEKQAQGWGQELRRTTDELRVAANQNGNSIAAIVGTTAIVTSLLKGQDDLGKSLKETHSALEEHRKWIQKTVKAAEEAFKQVNTISATATADINAVSGTATAKLDAVSTTAVDEVKALGAATTESVATITNATNEQIKLLSEAVTSQITSASTSLDSAATSVKESTEKLATSLDDFSTKNMQSSQEQLNALAQIKNQAQDTMNAFLNETRKMMDAFQVREDTLLDKLKGGVPINAQIQTLPLAIALGGSILISFCLVGLMMLLFVRVAFPSSVTGAIDLRPTPTRTMTPARITPPQRTPSSSVPSSKSEHSIESTEAQLLKRDLQDLDEVDWVLVVEKDHA